MKLGLLTAAFPDLTLEEVADWAGAHGFETLEIACWPAGGGDRLVPRQRQALDDVVGTAVAFRRQAGVGQWRAVLVEHDPLDVRAAEIESEVRGHSGASYGGVRS